MRTREMIIAARYLDSSGECDEARTKQEKSAVDASASNRIAIEFRNLRRYCMLPPPTSYFFDLHKPRNHTLSPLTLQCYFHSMAAAGRSSDRFTLQALHFGEQDDMVARGMDDFKFVADLKLVFYVDFGGSVRAG